MRWLRMANVYDYTNETANFWLKYLVVYSTSIFKLYHDLGT